MFWVNDYQFQLPQEAIAQYPLVPAHSSKLLHCTMREDWMELEDKLCSDLATILQEHTLLIANNSQVFAARIPLKNQKIIHQTWKETILFSGEILIVKLIYHEDQSIDQHRCIIRWSDKKKLQTR